MADSDRTASLMTPSKLAQTSRARPPVSPSAWLDQMAADAGHMHVGRLVELRQVLETHARGRKYTPLVQALEELAQALPGLDFSLLESKGWWARTTGKTRSAGAEFSGQFESIDDSVKAVVAQVQSLQKTAQAETAATERTLLEMEVEYKAIDKILDQGARWLQDMRKQLQERQAKAAEGHGDQQVRDDTMRCEILAARLKLLKVAASAAQAIHQQALATSAQRTALLKVLQQAHASDIKSWQGRMSALAAAAVDDKPPSSLEGPMDTHRDLQLCIKQVMADCAAMQTQEELLATGLQLLGQQLDALR
jgi:hypothetical protein